MSEVRYRGVSSGEQTSEEDESKKSQAEKIEKASAKIHSAIWIAAAVFVCYLTDFFTVATQDARVNRVAMSGAIICFVGSMCIMLYLTLWLPLVMKITIPWEIYCPNMIPASTALGVGCYVLLMVSFWPIWGLVTPLIVTVQLMGFLFSSHFIPWPC